jgi:tetrahydromethanopterin S-methyltransferase subunit D
MIMFKVRSPMLVAIGMYLPISITSAIFVGGVLRWVGDTIRKRRALNEAQTARVENVGVLVASGLIAGEALAGLVTGWFNYKYGKLPELVSQPSYIGGVVVMAVIALLLIQMPLANAGDPNEPAPPTAIM